MSEAEVIGEVVAEEPGEVLEVYAPSSPTLFRSEEPGEVLERATETANVLKDVVRKQGLLVTIQGREHARVEAWTLLGTLVGVFPYLVWSRKLEDGWEARVEARTKEGAVVGAAEAECLRSERTWAKRDDYALRSMAQTRATSKALRQPLGFVMTLAGFEATPAEEMPHEPREQDSGAKRARMRDRIAELCVQADATRKAAEGTTAREVDGACKTGFSEPLVLADADEQALAAIGGDLKDWLEAGCNGEFKVVPF